MTTGEGQAEVRRLALDESAGSGVVEAASACLAVGVAFLSTLGSWRRWRCAWRTLWW